MIRLVAILQNLIVVDGCGACLTGVATWFLLASEFLPTGLPVPQLRYMAMVAFCFALMDGLALAIGNG